MTAPIKTPLTYDEAVQIAEKALTSDKPLVRVHHVAMALIYVDIASREQASEQHDETTCRVCVENKTRNVWVDEMVKVGRGIEEAS